MSTAMLLPPVARTLPSSFTPERRPSSTSRTLIFDRSVSMRSDGTILPYVSCPVPISFDTDGSVSAGTEPTKCEIGAGSAAGWEAGTAAGWTAGPAEAAEPLVRDRFAGPLALPAVSGARTPDSVDEAFCSSALNGD